MTNIPHKPIGEPEPAYMCPWCQAPAKSSAQLKTHIDMRHRPDSYAPKNYVRKAAQPQPLDDGELREAITKIWLESAPHTWQRDLDKVMAAIAAYSPSTEAAVLDALIYEYKKNRRWFERMAEYADVKQDAMNEYDDRIAELKAQKAALESVTTDEGK